MLPRDINGPNGISCFSFFFFKITNDNPYIKPVKNPRNKAGITPFTRNEPTIKLNLTSPIPIPLGYIRWIISISKNAPIPYAKGIHQCLISDTIFIISPTRVKGSIITLGIILKSISINDITISTLHKIIPATVFTVN